MGDVTLIVQPAPQIALVVDPRPQVDLSLQFGQGPAGPKGDKGDPGAPGSGIDKHYQHNQAVAAMVWIIQHGLAKYPSVRIFDSAGDEVDGDLRYPDPNTVEASFSAPFSGVAYCN